MATLKNAAYLPALTGVRAIAAYMVFLHHFNSVFPGQRLGEGVHSFVQELHVGVTLFFVLSGFLIAYRYFDAEDFSFRNYLVNRVARIYPMYFLVTTLTFLTCSFTKDNLLAYIFNITFVRGYSETYKFTGVAHGWSLTVEETFYFLAPLLFMLLKRKKYNFILLSAALVLCGMMLVYLFKRISFYGFMDSYSLMFFYTFFGRCFEFFVGIGLAVLFKKGVVLRGNHFTYLGIAVIVLCVYLLSMVKGDYDFGFKSNWGKVINNLILPLFGISMFYYGLLTEKTLVSRQFGSKLFVLLGKSSYVFYLIHMGIIATFLRKFLPANIILFLVLNLLAIGLFLLIEKPTNKYIRRRFRSHDDSDRIRPSGALAYGKNTKQ